jgi:hypothetical protein
MIPARRTTLQHVVAKNAAPRTPSVSEGEIRVAIRGL